MKKAVMKEKSGKILELLSGVKRRAFFGRRCCKNVRVQSGRKKGGLERFSKVECQVFLSKEIVLGHPCIPRVIVDTGSDKQPGLRKKGRSWREGGGGEGAGTYTRHKGLKQNFM